MRERKDSEGKIIGSVSLPYENVPDDYQIQSILTDKLVDLNYVGFMKAMSDFYKNTDFSKEPLYAKGSEFQNNDFYVEEVLEHMAMDYLESARMLESAVLSDRASQQINNQIICSHYVVPCAFCCKHSIELKLKHCLFIQGIENLGGHSILDLWNQIEKIYIPDVNSIDTFIKEVDKVDPNEMTLRYGFSKKLVPLSEKFQFDVVQLVANTMFLFNILEEYVVHKCRRKYTGTTMTLIIDTSED